MIDIIMWSMLALLVGFTAGFKTGLSINKKGPPYEQGVRDGKRIARIFPPNPRDE